MKTSFILPLAVGLMTVAACRKQAPEKTQSLPKEAFLNKEIPHENSDSQFFAELETLLAACDNDTAFLNDLYENAQLLEKVEQRIQAEQHVFFPQ